ncbi:MAG: glutamate racemase [Clostridia bacterium]|nr:glutamate racemase [Clostridia bacterium]
MDNRPIGIFDSGLGGLTCVKKVMELLPHEDIIYFGDTGRVPYGSRSPETIVKYTRQDIRFLESFDIKYIIIACGTASSAALPWIQQEFTTEICGVLKPACQAAVSATRNGKIGVIGTQGTVRSGKYEDTLKELDANLSVISKACPLFVPLVENGHTEGQLAYLAAEEYLLPVKNAGVDTLILGCTHYPLLKDTIRQVMGDSVTLIDAGAETAAVAKRRLEELDLLAEDRKGTARYYVSDRVEGFTDIAQMFLNREIEGCVKQIEIEGY